MLIKTLRTIPYSSIVGGGLVLVDDTGKDRFILHISGTTAGITREQTEAIANRWLGAHLPFNVPDHPDLKTIKTGIPATASPDGASATQPPVSVAEPATPSRYAHIVNPSPTAACTDERRAYNEQHPANQLSVGRSCPICGLGPCKRWRVKPL